MEVSQVGLGSLFTNFFILFGVSDAGLTGLAQLASHLWLAIVVGGYFVSLVGIIVVVYALMRLFELRQREEEYYGTVLVAAEAADSSPRWRHIEALAGGGSASEWREAIIEADIMLEDMLTRQGYSGDGVGEKLQQVERSDFNTLEDAWEAHKVRNQVAHQGSSFDLSETLARRTIARYEAVFREFGIL